MEFPIVDLTVPSEVYILAWSGGYDVPQYEAFASLADASNRAIEWAADLEEGVGTLDVLRLNLGTMEIEGVTADDLRPSPAPQPIQPSGIESEETHGMDR